jgi:electron transport complex protein RnfG
MNASVDIKSVLNVGLLLAFSALLGTGVMAITHYHAIDYIVENQRQVLIRSLDSVLPGETYDNNIVEDNVSVVEPDWLGSKKSLTIYRARKSGNPVGVVITAIAPNGYSGAIKFIVGVDYSGEISGVRVVAHRETPGLGDGIEAKKSNWVLGYNQRSLKNTSAQQWAVKKDGGVIDQLTGATITPRAITQAVYKCIQYYEQYRDTLFLPEEEVPNAIITKKTSS